MGVRVCLFRVYAVLYICSGLATGPSPVQGVPPTVYRLKKLKKRPRSEGQYSHWERTRENIALAAWRLIHRVCEDKAKCNNYEKWVGLKITYCISTAHHNLVEYLLKTRSKIWQFPALYTRFWDVTPGNAGKNYRCCCLLLAPYRLPLRFDLEYADRMFLRKVYKLQPDYTASRPTR
jgi:hypothetical protein